MTQFYVNGEKNIQRRFTKGQNYTNVSFFYFIEIPKEQTTQATYCGEHFFHHKKQTIIHGHYDVPP